MDKGLLPARRTLALPSAADRYQSMMDIARRVAHPSVMEDWQEKTGSRAVAAQSELCLFSSESVLNILKLIFAGATLSEALTIVARLIEAQGKGMLCAIWLLENDGRHFRCAAAPTLPAAYIAQVDALTVGPKGASCGTAVCGADSVGGFD